MCPWQGPCSVSRHNCSVSLRVRQRRQSGLWKTDLVQQNPQPSGQWPPGSGCPGPKSPPQCPGPLSTDRHGKHRFSLSSIARTFGSRREAVFPSLGRALAMCPLPVRHRHLRARFPMACLPRGWLWIPRTKAKPTLSHACPPSRLGVGTARWVPFVPSAWHQKWSRFQSFSSFEMFASMPRDTRGWNQSVHTEFTEVLRVSCPHRLRELEAIFLACLHLDSDPSLCEVGCRGIFLCAPRSCSESFQFGSISDFSFQIRDAQPALCYHCPSEGFRNREVK